MWKRDYYIKEKFMTYLCSYWHGKFGWFKQQVVKLAIARKIKTKFYLVLDADIFFTKKVQFSDILFNVLPSTSFPSVQNKEFINGDIYLMERLCCNIIKHTWWWHGSTHLLQVEFPSFLSDAIGVTPQVLAVGIRHLLLGKGI
jgi:hypothetical protein